MGEQLIEALRGALEDAGVSYRRLAELLGEAGVDRSKDTIHHWITAGQPMRPDEVFAVEKVLELAPGSLSRLDGYLPVEAVDARTPEDAIKADHRLNPNARKYLLATVRGVLAEERRESRQTVEPTATPRKRGQGR